MFPRWLRYGIATTTLGLAAFVAIKASHARKEHRRYLDAVAAIKASGTGWVLGEWTPPLPFPVIDRMASIVGCDPEDFCWHTKIVVSYSLDATIPTDFSVLAQFPRVDRLEFGPQPVSSRYPLANDLDVRQIPLNANIRAIDLSFTNITDDTLDHLSDMKQLKRLIVSGTKISNGGIDRFRKRLPDVAIVREN